jgi:cyclase
MTVVTHHKPAIAVCALALTLVGARLNAQTYEPGTGEIEVLRLRPNIYMLVGAGANVTAQVGEDGILLVDVGEAGFSDRLLREVRKLSDKPIRYAIDTHAHPGSAGANANIVRAGVSMA